MPKVSIIIPVYNVERYLQKCLDSVENQTLKDFEVIIVDDGSPDESYKIYREYEQKDSRFKVIRKENGGVSCARNTGLKQATGEYILFIDSDDWMEEDACEILYNAAVAEQADMVIADTYMYFEDGHKEYVHVFAESFTTEDALFIREYQKAIIAFPYNPKPYCGKCTIPTGLGGPWNKLVKREVVQKINIMFDPYVNGMFDDCLYSLHVLSNVEKIVYIAKPVYYYRMVSNSLLHKYRKNTLETNSHIFERIKQYIDKFCNTEEFESVFDFYVSRRLIESMGTYFFADSNPMKLNQRMSSFRETVRSEPYCSSIQRVDVSKMKKSWRMIIRSINHENYWLAVMLYYLKDIKNKISCF